MLRYFGVWTVLLLGLSLVSVRLLSHPVVFPFIYYPSYDARAIVIERVNGQDRRFLGQGLMTQRYYWSLQWSPSGKWLAWGDAAEDLPELIDPFTVNGWISALDGRENINLTETWGWGSQWAWSPVADHLLVTSATGWGGPSEGYVVDMASRQVLLRYESVSDVPTWAADGSFIWYVERFFTDENGEPITTPRQQLVTITLTNQRHIIPIANSEVYSTEGTFGINGISLFYIEPISNTLRLEFPLTGMVRDLGPIKGELFQVHWSPDRRAALIYTVYNTTPSPGGTSIISAWLLTLRGLRLVAEDAVVPEQGGWHDSGFDERANWPQWTPDSTAVVVATRDGHVYWARVEPFRVETLALPVTPLTSNLNGGQMVAQPSLGTQWLPDSTQGYLLWMGSIWELDRASLRVSPVPARLDTSLGISPSGHYLALVRSSKRLHDPFALPEISNWLIDPDSDRWLALPAYYDDSDFGQKGGYADWHWSEDWVMLKENVSQRYPDMAFTLAHASGLIIRPLGITQPWHMMFDWLPPNVPIED